MFKRNFLISTAVLAALFLVFGLTAHTLTVTKSYESISGKVFTFSGTLESADEDTSGIFDLSQFDADWGELPFTYQVDIESDSGYIDSLNMQIDIYGSLDGVNWHLVDTLFSLEAHPFIDTTLAGASDFNNLHYPMYQAYINQLADNGTDSTFSFQVDLYGHQD